MKILFTRFPLESAYGGAEIQTLSLMDELATRGHAVAFLGSCPVMLDQCRTRGIPTVELHIGNPPVTKFGVISFIWRKKRMKRMLENALDGFHGLDAIVMMSLSEKILLSATAIAKKIRVLWLEHDKIGRWLTKNPALPTLIALSKDVTTVGVSELSKQMYSDLGWPKDAVVAIPNGINPTRFENFQKKNHDGYIIGCIARLSQEKGVDVLMKAVQEIPDVSLRIVGEGHEKKSLEKHCNNRMSIENTIEDLTSFYEEIDLLVLPSREHDPFGLVAAEAMLLGIPVVVTDACGIAHSLTNNEDAVIVHANSVESLMQGIQHIRTIDSIGAKGKQTAEQLFTIERMVDAYEKILTT